MRTGFVVNPGVVMYVSGRAGLPQTEVTWAKILQENGYDTAAVGMTLICLQRTIPNNVCSNVPGKWHLGWDESSYGDQQHGPLGHGFNHFFGMPFTLVDGFEETRPFFTYSQFSAEVTEYELYLSNQYLFMFSGKKLESSAQSRNCFGLVILDRDGSLQQRSRLFCFWCYYPSLPHNLVPN